MELLKDLKTRLLKAIGSKNSWGKNDLAELIRDQYTQILEKNFKSEVETFTTKGAE